MIKPPLSVSTPESLTFAPRRKGNAVICCSNNAHVEIQANEIHDQRVIPSAEAEEKPKSFFTRLCHWPCRRSKAQKIIDEVAQNERVRALLKDALESKVGVEMTQSFLAEHQWVNDVGSAVTGGDMQQLMDKAANYLKEQAAREVGQRLGKKVLGLLKNSSGEERVVTELKDASTQTEPVKISPISSSGMWDGGEVNNAGALSPTRGRRNEGLNAEGVSPLSLLIGEKLEQLTKANSWQIVQIAGKVEQTALDAGVVRNPDIIEALVLRELATRNIPVKLQVTSERSPLTYTLPRPPTFSNVLLLKEKGEEKTD